MMAEQWYYAKNNETHGPVSSSELRQLAQDGKLTPTDHIWKQGMIDWVPADRVKGLFVEKETASTPSPPSPTSSPSPQPVVSQSSTDKTLDIGEATKGLFVALSAKGQELGTKATEAARELKAKVSTNGKAGSGSIKVTDGSPPVPKQVLLMLIVGSFILMITCCGIFGAFFDSTSSGSMTVWEVDEEFRIATSHQEAGLVSANMLIELRRDSKWSWELLDDEVDFQFGYIEEEYEQWKRNRIAAGDRYE